MHGRVKKLNPSLSKIPYPDSLFNAYFFLQKGNERA